MIIQENDKWYVSSSGKRIAGPFTNDELVEYLKKANNQKYGRKRFQGKELLQRQEKLNACFEKQVSVSKVAR